MITGNPSSERRAPRFVWSRVALFLFFSVCGLVFLFADGRCGHIFASVTGIVCLLLVILPPVPIAGRFISPLCTAPIVWFASIIVVEVVLPPDCSVNSVEQEAVPIIRQLDEYRRIHGYYPPTLAAAGITLTQYRCGTFTYALGADGSCSLYIGDYNRDNFAAWWDSDTREWYLDT